MRPNLSERIFRPLADFLEEFMGSNPQGKPGGRPNRQSIRLKEYNYSQSGAYFFTLCTHNRVCLFGNVVDGKIRLNRFGKVVQEEWLRSEQIRREIRLDEFVVMPNHVHGIVWITKEGPVAITIGASNMANAVGAHGSAPLPDPKGPRAVSRPPLPGPRSLSSFIAGYKSIVTKRINQLRGTLGSPVWQRNYYEHIIRDDEPLNQIRQYILDNPTQWATDRENPEAVKPESPGQLPKLF